jgi:hypothetical protein
MRDDALKAWLHQDVRVTLKDGSIRVGRLERTPNETGKYHLLQDGPARAAHPGVEWQHAIGVGGDFSADDVVEIAGQV